MEPWVAASSIAVLVATVPLCWLYRVFQGLPEPIVLSHRRWSLKINLLIILTATATAAAFIRGLYYRGDVASDPALAGLRLLIAATVYVLAFVLLIRQYVGLYPEYFVATGRGGFTVRKRLYQNIVRVEETREVGRETEVLIYLKSREKLALTIPTPDIPRLYELIEVSHPDS